MSFNGCILSLILSTFLMDDKNDEYIPRERFYHLTAQANVSLILKHGLKADAEEGMIFLFDNLECADSIAVNQCFMREYALFEVKKSGITSALIPDNVAEFTAKYQYYVKQEKIPPEHLHFVDNYTVDMDALHKKLYGNVKFVYVGTDHLGNKIED